MNHRDKADERMSIYARYYEMYPGEAHRVEAIAKVIDGILNPIKTEKHAITSAEQCFALNDKHIGLAFLTF